LQIRKIGLFLTPLNKVGALAHPDCHRGGRASTENKYNGALAQLVEQWTENPCVPSSILGGTTKMKGADSKVGFFLIMLSNCKNTQLPDGLKAQLNSAQCKTQ
jgi:hypothetical protein